MTHLLDSIVIDSKPNPGVSVIWMHGLGDSGEGWAPIVNELNLSDLPGIRFIFPHANTMPVTINGGYVMRSWYDIVHTDLGRQEDEKGLRESQILVDALIEREIARGIPANRIVLGGFSQGCAMTLQAGLRYPQKLAGLMCLSGYVPLADKVAAERQAANQETPIFMVHGRMDPVIPIERAVASRDLLATLGYQIEWHDYPMQHSACAEELAHISAWLKKVLA
ncbi:MULTISPECIES: alpha/beta hydrolase [unclassified Duganella]|uniref:alpha/beta hydrolase n=1 Tax=unclassified Duganella TaxID=2636909 RepID=UPI0006F9DD70|nr:MULTISPECIES: carboxylesterase [unclassified Duganella]KQV53659.1 carboxylesterase [Duganella sp. Root336D2]KRB83787.1 carboxylesterase [Duganella sp. Root198D2]